MSVSKIQQAPHHYLHLRASPNWWTWNDVLLRLHLSITVPVSYRDYVSSKWPSSAEREISYPVVVNIEEQTWIVSLVGTREGNKRRRISTSPLLDLQLRARAEELVFTRDESNVNGNVLNTQEIVAAAKALWDINENLGGVCPGWCNVSRRFNTSLCKFSARGEG